MAKLAMSDARERAALASELGSYNIVVAQPDDPPLFTETPQSTMVPWHWRAADLAHLLEKIGANLKLEAGGQRRTLRLANPGLPYGTTPTFWVSIQYILPGEVATNHRHSATALRFIMTGSGSDTIVNGECYPMNEGDLVLTPSWSWHDHENKGTEPMVWIDVLDISLVRALHATFFEGSEQPRQDVLPVPDQSFRQYGSGIMRPTTKQIGGDAPVLLAYPWSRALDALEQAAGLEGNPFDDVLLEYQNPSSGGPALPTLGTMLQMIRPGVTTQAHRHTGGVVYYAVQGQGVMSIDDHRFEWSQGDFIALPPWARHSHANATNSAAILFQINDFPVLRSLGLYREVTA